MTIMELRPKVVQLMQIDRKTLPRILFVNKNLRRWIICTKSTF